VRLAGDAPAELDRTAGGLLEEEMRIYLNPGDPT
jgi:hypothetical protein